MGMFDTKDWKDRIDEVFATIQECGARPDTLDQVRHQLGMLPPNEQQLLSESLHLNLPWNTGDKKKRNLLRAVTFLEVLLFDVPPGIVNRYAQESPDVLKTRIGTLLGALETPTQGKPDLGKHRPLTPGMSISGGEHPGPGSIGCFVTCNRTGRKMLLSNEHVLKAEFGVQRPEAKPIIRQPAKMFAGMPHDRVAEYSRGILDTTMDAAVACLDPLIKGVNVLPDGMALRYAEGPLPTGELVFKWGAASGKTMGWLGPLVEAEVPHNRFGASPIHFRDQLQIAPRIDARTRKPQSFQIPGDSGSILYDRNGRILALLHGGALGGFGALATPIDRVFKRLDVHFDESR